MLYGSGARNLANASPKRNVWTAGGSPPLTMWFRCAEKFRFSPGLGIVAWRSFTPSCGIHVTVRLVI
jgi:hypothetical protein